MLSNQSIHSGREECAADFIRQAAPQKTMTKNLLVGSTLLLFCHAAAHAQIDDCAAIPHPAKIAEVGAFSNMRYTGEHAYGYVVMLWRAGRCFFGILVSSQGLAADMPIGELRDVKYDQKRGTLSFSARVTMGVVNIPGSKGPELSRDLFTFDGDVKATQLTGIVTYTNQNKPHFKPKQEKVFLGSSKEEAEVMHGSTTYGEWRGKWDPVLRVRGPKW